MGRVRKPRERTEARRLRRELGMPMKRIASEVGVSVATVHAWTHDIPVSEEHRVRNLFGPRGPQNPERIAKRAASWKRRNQERRLSYQREGRERGRHRDPLHIAGCMLYWAEGAKSRNRIKFCNSDPEMVRFFASFLRRSLGITSDRMTIRLHVYTNNGISLERIEGFWLKLLELPRSSLRKHAVNNYPTSSSGTKRNLPYGVCTLSVAKSTRELQQIYGAIQEYAGFDEPRWLDGPPRKPRPRAAVEQR